MSNKNETLPDKSVRVELRFSKSSPKEPEKKINLDTAVKVATLFTTLVFSIIGVVFTCQGIRQNKLISEQSAYLRSQGNEQNLIRLADSRVLERQQTEYFEIKDSLAKYEQAGLPVPDRLGTAIIDLTRTWKPIVSIGPDSSKTKLQVEDRLVSSARGWLLSYLLNYHCEEQGCDLISRMVFDRGDFSFAEIYNQEFRKVDLGGRGIPSNYSQLRNCKFIRCDFANQKLNGALMEDVLSKQSNFEGGMFRNSVWRGRIRLSNSLNKQASFRSTDFRGATFENITRDPEEGDTIMLDKIDFGNANFSFSKMNGPICVRKCYFFGAIFKGIQWKNVRFEDCFFDHASFIGVEAEDLILKSCKVRDSRVSQSSIRNLNLLNSEVVRDTFLECAFPMFSMRGRMPDSNLVEGISFYNNELK